MVPKTQMLWEENKGGGVCVHPERSSPLSEIVPGLVMKYKVMLDLSKPDRHGNMLINTDLNLMEVRKNYPRMY